MEVEMKIRGLMMDPVTNMPIVILKDVSGATVLPIWVGVYEANAIALEIEKVSTPRPMTHDLIKTLLLGLNTGMRKVVVSELKDDTFYAVIWLDRDGELISVDSRPSDALALALRLDCPIYVEETVLKSFEGGLVDVRQSQRRRVPALAGGPERRGPRPLQDVEPAPSDFTQRRKDAKKTNLRKLFFWKLKRREIRLGERTAIMGVLNVTPDSFSDGGRYIGSRPRVCARSRNGRAGRGHHRYRRRIDAAGGAPYRRRTKSCAVFPVLKRLKDRLTIPISIDTYKAEVAERAIELGAEIINDPSGLTFEPHLARAVANHDAGLILNHMRGRPETWAKLVRCPTRWRQLAATLTLRRAARAIRASTRRASCSTPAWDSASAEIRTR